MNLQKESIFEIDENIFFTNLDDEICLFCSSKAEYLNLNNTGSHIWKLIEKKYNFREIVEELIREFEITQELCISEVNDFIKDLIKREIITLN
tara:strand:- start:173 stop:451 length:279 start_codon:yes stop_codon:yes gene_type:complete